jgi:hypothetical protein
MRILVIFVLCLASHTFATKKQENGCSDALQTNTFDGSEFSLRRSAKLITRTMSGQSVDQNIFESLPNYNRIRAEIAKDNPLIPVLLKNSFYIFAEVRPSTKRLPKLAIYVGTYYEGPQAQKILSQWKDGFKISEFLQHFSPIRDAMNSAFRRSGMRSISFCELETYGEIGTDHGCITYREADYYISYFAENLEALLFNYFQLLAEPIANMQTIDRSK